MYRSTLRIIRRIYGRVIRSIAFYPVLIGGGFFLASMFLLSFENIEFAKFVKKNAPFLYVQNADTAKTILSTLVGSVISLMVFSFSMVMVVLNQASSNFSPRLLPGLISDKRHQIILGIYVGTLIHCALVLISLGSYDSSKDSIGFSTMIAAILGIVCVGLFISFIHNIANTIRIDNIVLGIFEDSSSCLRSQMQENEEIDQLDTENWHQVRSDKTGYFRKFDDDLLKLSSTETKNVIEVVPYAYQHIWEGDIIFKTKEAIDKDRSKELLLGVHISADRYEGGNFLSGAIKLVEVAVKALSPGINDPGTATDVLHKLGIVLEEALSLPTQTSLDRPEKSLKIVYNTVSSDELMRLTIQPIRNYAKSDPLVIIEIVKTLQFLLSSSNISTINKNPIERELQALIIDVRNHIQNDLDLAKIFDFINPEYHA